MIGNPDRRDDRLERVATIGTGFGSLVLLVAEFCVRNSSSGYRHLGAVYWFDCTLVQIACALPIAWWVGIWCARGPRGLRRVGAALAVAVIVVAVLTLKSTTSVWIVDSVLRSTLYVLAASTCTVVVVAFSNAAGETPISTWTASSLLLVAYVVPATYLHARLRNETNQVGELLDQHRFGEALEVSLPIARLAPRTVINGRPIEEIAGTLSQGVASIRAELTRPISVDATDAQLIGRARSIAMLGRTDDALAVLQLVRNPGIEGLLLEGTIRETRGEWDAGLEKYREARKLIDSAAAAPPMIPQRVQSIRGIAYCARKAGRSQEAEAAYRDLLVISPTADAHFLVAQFYEDAQETSAALRHVKQAIALDPLRYAESGRSLINKLQTAHFGCWGVYSTGLTSH